MKKIYNPTDREITILIKGIVHSVEANSTVEKKDEVAQTWFAIHNFLQISDIQDTVKVESKEEDIDERKKEPSIKELIKTKK